MKRIPAGVAVLAALVSHAAAKDLSPVQVFEGTTTTPARAGGTENVHLSVQSWGISGDRRGPSATREIPLSGFYIAHLLSRQLAATINGQTAVHAPGDYWTVPPAATMQVRTLGEYAVLETTVVSKQ
jgi:hypothetical protein